MERAGLLRKYKDVLEGFKQGLDQGIPEHHIDGLEWYTPPNHTSALLAQKEIELNFEKELLAGRMFRPFSHTEVATRFPFFFSNPLGMAVNSDGSVRPINDLSYPHGMESIPLVNNFVDKEEFETTWDDFKVVAKFFREHPEPFDLGLFDWEKAYWQIPTRMSQWPYLMVQDFGGCLLLDTRITFGGVAGCGSFGRPEDAWKELMFHEFDLIHIFWWVDDNLFVKGVNSKTDVKAIVERSTSLGVKTNQEKYSQFAKEQKFIGFVWNSREKTVRLPEGRKEERLQQIEPFLEPKKKFSYHNSEVLAGSLNHISYDAV